MCNHPLWLDFKLFIKNLTGIEYGLMQNGYVFNLNINNHNVYTFYANNIKTFESNLNAYKLHVIERYRKFIAC